MLVRDLVTECSLHINDPQNAQVSQAQWLIFLQSAARDLRNKGWLRRQSDDTSILTTASTYTYAVPSGFAYVRILYQEETINGSPIYVREIPRNHWAPDGTIHVQAGIPVFFFSTVSSVDVGKHIMVVGQKRPTAYLTTNETVDGGMESVLRERACAYALQFAASGNSELARWRQIMATTKFQNSEILLRNHPQEFRVLPGSLVVPGAE